MPPASVGRLPSFAVTTRSRKPPSSPAVEPSRCNDEALTSGELSKMRRSMFSTERAWAVTGTVARAAAATTVASKGLMRMRTP